MRFALLLIYAALLPFSLGSAHAQAFSIGVAVPLDPQFSRLGTQILDGARIAASVANPPISIETADTQCSAQGGEKAARELIERDVSIIVGFLCTEAIEAALPLLKDAGILVITPAIRTTSLTDRRDRTGWPVYRLAPRADTERDAVAEILVPRWRQNFFAIVDDGTIYGRELAENLRASAELQELSPVFVDTFRPQLDNQIGLAGRLRRAGATHVFVGGDRADIAILARDAASMDYALTIAGGEALRLAESEVPLAQGTLMVGLPRWRDIATPDTIRALAAGGVAADGYTIPAFAATQIAIAAGKTAQGTSMADVLSTQQFETALGTLSFDDKGELKQDFYRLFRFDGDTFKEVE